jgi:acyl-CoA thioester hydrolase
MLEEYAKVNRFRVVFGEVDMMRHVNNVTYLRWAETSRTEYFAEVLDSRIGGSEGAILARLEIVFERQMAYRERVAIGCRVSRIGTKSFDCMHEIWSEDHGLRCARVVSTMVAMDYETNTTIAVPKAWRERIAAFDPPATADEPERTTSHG